MTRVRKTITVSKKLFSLIQELEPKKDEKGRYLVCRPQDDSVHLQTKRFHDYGNQDFCEITIKPNLPQTEYLYLMKDDKGTILYIGQTENLRKRFRTDYRHISPRNCFVRGQSTNCKVNANILKHYNQGRRVYLYGLDMTGIPSGDRKREEKSLINAKSPPWNA